LEQIRDQLKKVVPMPAVFDRNYVRRLEGSNVKSMKTKWDAVLEVREDIKRFKEQNGCERLVMIWCGSTEIFMAPDPVHDTVESLEKAIRENHAAIPPSMIYAYAALQEGVPFLNGAPNLTVDVPGMIELARQNNVPIGGKDFKTGQTLMKTLLAPGLKARMLGVQGWFSTNILGNR
ncbi:MAG: inositol-3-phosphate synthase, partial [Candidatus Latescibacterota bacterium]|nr:inositol-3-phosphate synthase [Candidatus Latescibacterota bacterium]